ncbi:MAG: hypothetical protein DHS20C19_01800 [Acidimicrobiales bacterium]|nr:MAG: hypothetical protein DHS20C19_01800 [Acidimicrobiales bacterium]
MSIAERLTDALRTGSERTGPVADLFARVRSSIDDDRRIRRQRQARTTVVAALAGAALAVAMGTTERRQGEWNMDWWILELVWFALMVGLAVWLGPFIRRFGKAYAADVFRANPRTGKSFIVLMDVAYYLIFMAYILFTVQFEPAGDWENTVNANQLQASTVRLGGILLIVGLLHGLNVLTLPVMGRIFTLNRQLDEDAAGVAS